MGKGERGMGIGREKIMWVRKGWRGNGKGRGGKGGKGRVGDTTCLLLPTGFCLKYHPGWYITVLMSFDMPYTLYTDNGLCRILHQRKQQT